MKSSRYTLIVDGNYFLFKTLYVLPRTGTELLKSSEDCEVFMRKLATDFSYQLRLLDGFIGQVVWTVDSKSWRKDFYPQAEYKATRTQDGSLNWDNFKKVSEGFKDLLESKGVVVSRVDGAEGDDLMFAWNTECLAKDRSTIILTGDRDMLQLVGKNQSNDSHCMVYSPAHKKIFVPVGFTEWKDEQPVGDFFDVLKANTGMASNAKKMIDLLQNKKNIEVIETDPELVRFTKILTGDAGDNVSSAYWYTKASSNGSTRTFRITDAKASLIVDEFKKKHKELNPMFLYSQEHIRDLAQITVRVMNAKHMSLDQIIGNLNVNVNLVVLSSNTIPEGILDEMFSHVESNIGAKETMLKEMATMKDLLKGTDYVTEGDGMKITSSFLKNSEDDGSDMSFITDRKNKGKVF
jgi:5'-3' exonuclease